jgi:hypothetical protein
MIQEAISSPLSPWESFYVIVGSSGAALTGLQFVVMALIADSRVQGSDEAVNAFGTPTVVHFCVVLLVAATLSAPWPTLMGPDLVIGATGVAGLAYVGLVTRRARRQTYYRPVLEDWLWHTCLPAVAYLVLFVAAIALGRATRTALFLIGGSALLLLFVGIHNAWDSVAYVAIQARNANGESRDTDRPASNTTAANDAEPILTGSVPPT